MTGKFFHRVAVSRWYNSQPGLCLFALPHTYLTIRWKPSSFSGLPPIKVTAARVSPPLPLLLSPSVPPLTRTAHLCSKLGEKVGRRSDRQRLTALGGRAGAEITFIFRGSVARPLFRIEA